MPGLWTAGYGGAFGLGLCLKVEEAATAAAGVGVAGTTGLTLLEGKDATNGVDADAIDCGFAVGFAC